MFKLLVAFLFLGVALSKPVEHEPVPILSQEMSVEPDGKFHYNFESGDGTKAQQDGEVKVIDKETVAQVVQGGFEYKGEDGKTYAVSYTADETGYHPQGEHLPVAPPVPASIARALAFLATLPPAKE